MGLLQDLFGDDDAAIAEGVYRKLEAIHDDVRRIAHIVSIGDRIIMSDIDTLTTLAQGMQVDENAEDAALAQVEATGVALQASITLLQQGAGSNPNLQPVIAMLTAQKAQSEARLAKMQADAASGAALEGTLPQPGAAASTASGAATVAPAPATAAGVSEAAPVTAPGSGSSTA